MTRTLNRIHPTVCFFLGCLLLGASGCTKPTTDIGLGIQPEAEVLQLSLDTVPVVLQTVRQDSLETDDLSTGLVGRCFHPRFGTVDAFLASQLRLSATGIDFGFNPVADSMHLVLRYTGDWYGTLRPQTFSVQPLVDSLSLDSAYFSNRNVSTTGVEWVDGAQMPLQLDPLSTTILGDDTLGQVLRVPLQPSIAQEILDLPASTFAGNTPWLNHLPGLLVRRESGGQGAVAIDISTGLSVMRIHYHNDTDTSFYDFAISPLSARVNLFEQDWVGELGAFNDPSVSTLPDDGACYVMSGSGCKTNLDFVGLEAYRGEDGQNATVLRAELVMPVVDPWFNKSFGPQDQLFLLMEGADDVSLPTPDQTAPIPVGGEYDRAANAYRFNLTSTVQALINGELANQQLEVVSSRAGISISGVVLQGAMGETPSELYLTLGE